MYHCKISFGGRATTERWIVADSILSVSGSGRETSAGSRSRSTMVRKTSFLSSEAQWGQRAARQQGAEMNEKNAADGDEDEAASSSSEGPSSSSRKKTRKRKAASANSIGRSSTGRSTTSSSRSSSSQLSRRKRTRRRHETSPSLNDPFSEASEGEDHQKEEDDNNDEEDWGGYNRSTGNAGYCLV